MHDVGRIDSDIRHHACFLCLAKKINSYRREHILYGTIVLVGCYIWQYKVVELSIPWCCA